MNPMRIIELVIIASIGFIIFKFKRKKNRHQQNMDSIVHDESVSNQNIEIPDSCTHCKNPNTKKIRLCEWCGNQII